MSTVEQQYCAIFENEFLFSNIVQLYLICKHDSQYRVHYSVMCMENVIGGVLIQPESSNYLQNCVFDTTAKRVILNGDMNCLKSKVITSRQQQQHGGNEHTRLNCNFITISLENTFEIIKILYNVLCDTNFFIDHDTHYINYIKNIKNNKEKFCRKKMKYSIS